MEWLVAAVPPITLLTALGVWYGYELALARGRYFGLDPTVIEFSTREYVMRSVVAVLGPLLVLLVVVSGLVWAHLIVRWLLGLGAGNAGWQRWTWAAGVGLVTLGIVVAVEGLRAAASATVLQDQPVLRCLLVGAGVLAVTYGAWLVQQAPSRSLAASAASTSPRLWQPVAYGLAGAAVMVSVFWAFSTAAEQRGIRDSDALYKSHFKDLPGVVVFAASNLALAGDGVCVATMDDPGSMYRWRYAGLRLLVRSDGRYFMIPAEWRPEESTAMVVDEAPGLRFEFQDPDTPDLCADPDDAEPSQP